MHLYYDRIKFNKKKNQGPVYTEKSRFMIESYKVTGFAVSCRLGLGNSGGEPLNNCYAVISCIGMTESDMLIQ